MLKPRFRVKIPILPKKNSRGGKKMITQMDIHKLRLCADLSIDPREETAYFLFRWAWKEKNDSAGGRFSQAHAHDDKHLAKGKGHPMEEDKQPGVHWKEKREARTTEALSLVGMNVWCSKEDSFGNNHLVGTLFGRGEGGAANVRNTPLRGKA